jgi:hypothetical protein
MLRGKPCGLHPQVPRPIRGEGPGHLDQRLLVHEYDRNVRLRGW